MHVRKKEKKFNKKLSAVLAVVLILAMTISYIPYRGVVANDELTDEELAVIIGQEEQELPEEIVEQEAQELESAPQEAEQNEEAIPQQESQEAEPVEYVEDTNENVEEVVEENKPALTDEEQEQPMTSEQEPMASEEEPEELQPETVGQENLTEEIPAADEADIQEVPQEEETDKAIEEEKEEEKDLEEEKEEEKDEEEFVGKTYTYEDDELIVLVTTSPENRIPEDAVLVVSKIEMTDEEYAECLQAMAEEYGVSVEEIEIFPYDVHFEYDEEEIEPAAGDVAVEFFFKQSINAEDADETHVAHIKDNGEVETVASDVANGNEITDFGFSVESFSKIVVTQVTKANGTPAYLKGDYPFFQTESDLMAYMRECVGAHKEYFSMYYQSEDLTSAGARNLLGHAVLDYVGDPHTGDVLDWENASWGAGISIANQSPRVVSIGCSFRCNSTEEEKAQVDDALDSIFDELGIYGMSDGDKAQAIYSWIVLHTSYGSCSDNPNKHPRSVYGALIEHKAVCQGICELVYTMMNKAGLPCRIVTSSSHGWNIVQVDGKWYYVDATPGSQYNDTRTFFLCGKQNRHFLSYYPTGNSKALCDMVNDLDYEAEKTGNTGFIGVNAKWTYMNHVITFEPVDRSQYSSLAVQGESTLPFERTMRAYYNQVKTFVIDGITEFGSVPNYYTRAACNVGTWMDMEFKGNPIPDSGLAGWMGDPTIVPCTWTDADITAVGLNLNGSYEIRRTHSYAEATNNPTCTEPGGIVNKCIYCGDVQETGQSLPALGHDFVETSRTNATCQKEGVINYKCSRCEETKQVKIDKVAHDFKHVPAKDKAPGCTTAGYTYYECTMCHQSKTVEVKATGHKWAENGITAAACTKGGQKHYICENCKQTKDVEIKPTGHVRGEPYVKEAPTCQKEGIEAIPCAVCHEDLETKPIPKVAHNYQEIGREEPTCTKLGKIRRQCPMCKDVQVEILPMTEHEWELVSGHEATCEEAGEAVYKCKTCKQEKTENQAPKGHTPVPMAPTDTTTGGVQCSVCKKILEEPTEGIQIRVDGVSAGEQVYINGVAKTAVSDGIVVVPASTRGLTSAVTYSYGAGSAGSYPTGMNVWLLHQDNETGLVESERAEQFDNLLTYRGTAFRITGNQGIRIKTSMSKGVRNALIAGDYSGYTLEEAGTVVAWTDTNGSPTLDGAGVIVGETYRRGSRNNIIADDGSTVTFANVLVFKEMDKTIRPLSIRAYAVLSDGEGNTVTLYGGILVRSIYAVAQQSAAANEFSVGSAGYNFLKNIIDYGKKH